MGALLCAGSFPRPVSAQAVQELIRQQTGQTMSQEEILEGLRQSGLSAEQIRQRLRARGLDPSIAEPYLSQLEGGGPAGALPPPSSDFVRALQSIGVVQGSGLAPEADTAMVGRRALEREVRERVRVKARHILVRYPPFPGEFQRDSVLQRAHDLHFRILAGENFSRVAREESDDRFTGRRGGDLGWIEPGRMSPGFEEAAFALERGEVSRPVETRYGVHLIKVEDREVRSVFGREVFAGVTSQFEPIISGPVDPGYRLGPNDEIILILTGDVELAYRLGVTRQGYLVIPDVGQISVNGLTLSDLEDRLYERLGRVYSGVQRGPDATTHFNVSLGRLRTNLVYVIGDVSAPGAYQVSSVATAFNALYRAGGPSERGSFRNVEVRRGGRIVARVDLYDYLVGGDASQDVRLEQGDIVFVPPAGPQVTVRGEIRRPATYEMKTGEGVSDLLAFAGGPKAEALLDRVHVDRILPPEERTPERERILIDVDAEALRDDPTAVPLRDGDRVAVFSVSDERRNRLEIRGDVHRPGEYEFIDGETVRSLIRRAGGLRPSAYDRLAHVRRLDRSDGSVDLHRVGLGEGAFPGLPRDMRLEDRDEVMVFSVDSLNAADSVTVSGPVGEPGRYALARGMTAEDAILSAGGFLRGADPYRAEVVRRKVSVDRSDTLTTRLQVAVPEGIPYPGDTLPSRDEFRLDGLIPSDDLPLESDDQVIVRALPGFPVIQTVQVVGEVQSPGFYVLETRDQTVTDVIAAAGGPTEDAHIEGFRLVRSGVPVGIDLGDALENPHGPEDLPVESGDSLVFPKFDPTVQVRGAVAFDARVLYRDGWSFDDYLSQAGGVLESADEGRASVEYPNGERAVVNRRRFFFDSKPEVLPGSVIFVPEEPEGERGVNVTGVITSTVSLLSTVATLALALSQL